MQPDVFYIYFSILFHLFYEITKALIFAHTNYAF